MRFFAPIPAASCLVALASPLASQRVLIKGATPTEVTVAIHKRVVSQDFVLEDSSQKQAIFTRDRGLVSQTAANGMVIAVHVVLELHIRYKQKGDSLQVEAREEAVGARENRQFEFRKLIRSREELNTMEVLLQNVKEELETRPAQNP